MFDKICSVTEIIVSLFIILQIYLARKQIKDDHDRARRENTTNLLLKWTKSIQQETNIVESIVEKFSFDQCRSLLDRKPFLVSKETMERIKEITPSATLPQEGTEYKLDGQPLAMLRWHTVYYLNLLESILTAWRLKTVETEIIEKEFAFLYDETKNWNVLANMRKATGGEDNFPHIKAFIEHIQQKKSSAQPTYNKTG